MLSPALIYLVQSNGMFVNPRGGLETGRTTWMNGRLHFQCHRDAKIFADKIGGTVVKLRVRATREQIKSKQIEPIHIPVDYEKLLKKLLRNLDYGNNIPDESDVEAGRYTREELEACNELMREIVAENRIRP